MSTDAVSSVRQWIDSAVMPVADQWDRDQAIPRSFLKEIAEAGLLRVASCSADHAEVVPAHVQGSILEEVGRGSLSLLSLLTVHGMTVHALGRWGTQKQQERWLPSLLRGDLFGAFALSEPGVGSDARHITTQLTQDGDDWILNGEKKWISGAQLADLYVVFAQFEEKPTAVLVPRNTPGLFVEPIQDMLGFRAAMLAKLRFENVRLPADHLLGSVGTGFSHVVGSSLDLGRFYIANGATGLIRACLEASFDYSRQRQQFGNAIGHHQLIRELLANMTTDYKASKALCAHAASLRESGDPASIAETMVAKYFTSNAATRAANDAVQIHGANGCSAEFPVQRYFRDAKITEIIEGTNQIQQLLIAQNGAFEFRKAKRKKS